MDRPGGAYVTQFMARRTCGVMYFAPIKPGGWGDPPAVPTRPKSRRTDREMWRVRIAIAGRYEHRLHLPCPA
jgi:hypothetical protein